MEQKAWPIWVISLSTAVERRAAMTQQMRAAALEFSFIDAVDGRRGLSQELEAQIDRDATVAHYGYGMSDGEYACALSHQLAYARILDEGHDGAIVLEDDAILTSAFAIFCKGRHYQAADFIQLFCFSARLKRGPGRHLLPNVRAYRLGASAFGAVGYSLSASAARQLRKTANPLSRRADWPTDVTRFGAMLTVPSIIGHPEPGAAASHVNDGKTEIVPPGFDFSSGYVRGWRRFITPASWKRFVERRILTRVIEPGFGHAD